MRSLPTTRRLVFSLALVTLALCCSSARLLAADSDGWIALIGPEGTHGWKNIPAGWEEVSAVYMSAGDIRSLASQPGKGVLFNGRSGRAPNLVTREKFSDVELHVEFLMPKGSNSGVKLEEVYEVQLFDSYGVTRPTGSHSGGVYPRAELLPKYHHIDDGYPPRLNASRPAGEWQTLDISFRAPRVDSDGKKTSDAVFVKVVLNGHIVQENLKLPCPTGHNWQRKEQPTGSILLQGDHGPVAFRNVRARALSNRDR